MRVLLLGILLVTVMLAGCTSDGTDGSEGPSSSTTNDPGASTPVSPPRTARPVEQYRLMTQFEFDQCDGVRFHSSLPMARAASLIHRNYTPLADANTAGLPAEEAKQATLVADLYQCETFTAGQYLFNDVWFGIIRIPVEPPADAKDAEAHAYIVQMVGAEDVLTAIWNVVHYPTHRGNATMEDVESTAKRARAGDYQWDVATATPDQGAASGTFAWYRELSNGDRLTWTGSQEVSSGDGGTASLAYPETAPFAGAAPVPGQPLPGQGSYHEDALFTGMDLVQEVAAYRE